MERAGWYKQGKKGVEPWLTIGGKLALPKQKWKKKKKTDTVTYY